MLKITYIIVLISFLSSCYYDKFENFKPKSECDTSVVVTYSGDLAVVFQQNCTTCHGGTAPSGGISLDTYQGARSIAQTGKLYSSIVWDGKTTPMPQGSATKINDCSIKKIRKWIDSNYPQ
jgi:mono/diheme cytochrome c family protein